MGVWWLLPDAVCQREITPQGTAKLSVEKAMLPSRRWSMSVAVPMSQGGQRFYWALASLFLAVLRDCPRNYPMASGLADHTTTGPMTVGRH